MAHDLNNPLTAVTMAAAALRTATDDEQRGRLIDLVEQQALRAGQIVAAAITQAGDASDDRGSARPTPDATAGAATDAPAGSRGDPARGTVLVVDDDTAVQALLTLALGQDGWHVIAVGTADDAVAALADHEPDLVLLDLNLRTESGQDVAARLTAIDAHLAERVVYLSGDMAAEQDVDGRPALRKPFALAQLRALAEQVATPRR